MHLWSCGAGLGRVPGLRAAESNSAWGGVRAGGRLRQEAMPWALDAELVFVKDWGEGKGKGRGTAGRAPG